MGRRPRPRQIVPTPNYFRTLGIPLIAGREFTDADTRGAPDVYIVNQAFAEKFFGREAL